jgi:hypothetical protein
VVFAGGRQPKPKIVQLLVGGHATETHGVDNELETPEQGIFIWRHEPNRVKTTEIARATPLGSCRFHKSYLQREDVGACHDKNGPIKRVDMPQ